MTKETPLTWKADVCSWWRIPPSALIPCLANCPPLYFLVTPDPFGPHNVTLTTSTISVFLVQNSTYLTSTVVQYSMRRQRGQYTIFLHRRCQERGYLAVILVISTHTFTVFIHSVETILKLVVWGGGSALNTNQKLQTFLYFFNSKLQMVLDLQWPHILVPVGISSVDCGGRGSGGGCNATSKHDTETLPSPYSYRIAVWLAAIATSRCQVVWHVDRLLALSFPLGGQGGQGQACNCPCVDSCCSCDLYLGCSVCLLHCYCCCCCGCFWSRCC